MKLKKIISLVIASTLVGTVMTGCVKPTASGGTSDSSKDQNSNSNKITLMSQDTTFGSGFKEYIKKAEKATGIKIDVITCPTNTDDRQSKITTILSSGDSSVDVITINDEMMSAFRNIGYLTPLQDTVMTPDVLSKFPKDYMKEMTMIGSKVYSVPCFMDILAFWVDQKKMSNAGLTQIKTKDDFMKYVEANSKNGSYGYGGAWEKTYVFNEIGTWVNLFGGDYYDWTNPNSKAAVQFLHDMVKKGQTPISQIADQYDPMMQKFFDGKYASIFMYVGAIQTFIQSGKYGSNNLHIAPMPTFNKKAAYMSTWQYVLNSASKNKKAAIKFLKYAASKQGELDYSEMSSRLPARSDALNTPNLKLDGLDDIKEYVKNTELHARPMAPQSMEFISAMGSDFQQYVSDKITLDKFCQKAQNEVKVYIKK